MPAEVQNAIDRAAAQYGRAVERLIDRMADTVLALRRRGLDREAILEALAETDVRALVLDELRFRADVARLVTAYRDELLANMRATGRITEATLDALLSQDAAVYLAEAELMADMLKRELTRAVLAQRSEPELRAALRDAYRPDHAKTLANTAMNTYSRAVQNEMALGDPPDALYAYEGPVDGITRDICLEMAAAGELTYSVIESRFPGAFLDGGGYNCRHTWMRAAAAEVVDTKNAAEMIDEKRAAGTWREPLTPQQQRAARAA